MELSTGEKPGPAVRQKKRKKVVNSQNASEMEKFREIDEASCVTCLSGLPMRIISFQLITGPALDFIKLLFLRVD